MINSDWKGKKVAFLGDSITFRSPDETFKSYWAWLQEYLGIEPLVYGQNGAHWLGAVEQTDALLAEHGHDVDAIFVLMGTNNYNNSVPIGEWFTYQAERVNFNGENCVRKHRVHSFDTSTVCGQINTVMKRLKEEYPLQQIVLMTTLHRGYANFCEVNVQPDENFANGLGLFIEQYVEATRQAADIWACPLIDLYRESGLYPMTSSHGQFFHIPETDRLHPNISGHQRMAKTMMARMLAMPATFR